jgi:hypothetical protein
VHHRSLDFATQPIIVAVVIHHLAINRCPIVQAARKWQAPRAGRGRG